MSLVVGTRGHLSFDSRRVQCLLWLVVGVLAVSSLGIGLSSATGGEVGNSQPVAEAAPSLGLEQLGAARASLDGDHPAGLSIQTAENSSPSLRAWSAMAWDPLAGVVVLFGGSSYWGSSSQAGYPDLNDTWTFANGTWLQLHPYPSPPATSMAGMAYDPSTESIVLFGGQVPSSNFTPVASNSTWEFSAGAWSNVTGGPAPSPRLSPSLATDPNRGGVVLFGGLQVTAGNGTNESHPTEIPEADTWEFLDTGWANITTSVGNPPPGRFNSGLVSDTVSRTNLLYGGWSGLSDNTHTFSDTWTLDDSGWANVTRSSSPPALGGESLAFVTSSSSVVLFGGFNPSDPVPSNETWVFSNDSWAQVFPSEVPLATYQGSFVDDPDNGYCVLLLGATTVTYTQATATWTFEQDNWSLAGENPTLPPPGSASLVYDDAADAVVLVAPSPTGSATPLESTWIFRDGNWSVVNSTLAPESRSTPALVYDPATGYVLLFGGSYHVDTWIFQAGNWTELFPASRPAESVSGGLAYDADDGYLVYFDGAGTWKWSGEDWVDLNLSTQPDLDGRAVGPNSMTYDPAGGYVVLAEASNGTCGDSDTYCLLTWTFSNGSWTDMTGKSTVEPPALVSASITYDPLFSAVVLFGGYCPWLTCTSYASNATWQFANAEWSEISTSNAPSPRWGVGLVFDYSGNQLLGFGGLGGLKGGSTSLFADSWIFSNGTWSQVDPRLYVPVIPVDVGVSIALTAVSPAVFGEATYTYSGLPPGCESANIATIVCTPQESGAYRTAVSVQYPGAAPADAVSSLTVAPLPQIESFFATSTSFVLGNSTELSVMVLGGTEPFEYVYAGLPSGCSSSNEASVSCTPAMAANYTVSVTVTDRYGYSSNAILALAVSVNPSTNPTGPPRGFFPSPLYAAAIGIVLIAAVAGPASVWVHRRYLRTQGEQLVASIQEALLEEDKFGKPPL